MSLEADYWNSLRASDRMFFLSKYYRSMQAINKHLVKRYTDLPAGFKKLYKKMLLAKLEE